VFSESLSRFAEAAKIQKQAIALEKKEKIIAQLPNSQKDDFEETVDSLSPSQQDTVIGIMYDNGFHDVNFNDGNMYVNLGGGKGLSILSPQSTEELLQRMTTQKRILAWTAIVVGAVGVFIGPGAFLIEPSAGLIGAGSQQISDTIDDIEDYGEVKISGNENYAVLIIVREYIGVIPYN
jgi:hypothetical protein